MPTALQHFANGVSVVLVDGHDAECRCNTTGRIGNAQIAQSTQPVHSRSVPDPLLTNSPRLDQLIRDGKLQLSLKDAISLALENNLDLAIARYNMPIADADILRTKAGGTFLGVNTGVVQGTPGGGVGGYGAGAPGAGAGGTTGGAGGEAPAPRVWCNPR